MTFTARGRVINCAARPLVMGIVNVNDDSFSGDGTLDFEAAWEIAARQIADGADIIDVGAESARTNRGPVSVEEEVRRLRGFLTLWHQRGSDTLVAPCAKGVQPSRLPVEDFSDQAHPPEAERRLRPRFANQLFPPLLSLNTWRPEVVAELLPHGGDLLNDLGALPDDRNARLCARHGAALLIMHSVGAPKVPHTHIGYGAEEGGVVSAVERFFAEKIALAEAAGLSRDAIILDPGLDFAKQREDNLRLIAGLRRLEKFGRPVLLPVSRKTFIGETLGLPSPADRDAGTVAALVAGQLRGAHIFRVHNVRAAAEAVRIVAACR